MDLSIGLVTLNAKFIHASLSLRYLRNAARNAGYRNVWLREFAINEPVWKIAAEIRKQKPDVVGVGVYIWNRTQSFHLIELLKKQNPSLSVAIGGPEVSFETELSPQYTTISGEGEKKWVDFLNYRARNEQPPADVLQRWNAYGTDLPDLTPPYLEEDVPLLKDRIAYLETSRGCPYHCSFCLSSLDKTVRRFGDEAVRDQIALLVRSGAKRIKFVDRTFNLQPKRMMDLMQWLTRFRETAFHFEVVGDILNEELLEFLETVPEGLFQFEIGVQTATEDVQETIRRKQDNPRLFGAIERLVRANKVHVHADLIFGLPGEGLEQAMRSFSRILELRPHELQLGFLKFLPGAPIREVVKSHRYQFQSFPPYETISNKDLTADEIIRLKNFAEVFDLFYNSKRFEFSIDRLLPRWNPIGLFDRLLKYMEDAGLFHAALSLDDQYRVFHDAFSLETDPMALDLLKLDYLYHQRVYRLPRFLQKGPAEKSFKAWRGDGRTPLVPFQHEIQLNGRRASLVPAPQPVYYAVVHPANRSGYMTPPVLKKAED
ncbi:MAG: DUF4080 domain-containing protein [Nitrospinae bacterium]|nr:DUF4080 domain-containing protein [Nitrospinota bacterium]